MSEIVDLKQLDLNQTYNYADYLTWQFNDAVELIKGKIMLILPASNVRHQDIVYAAKFSFFFSKQLKS